MTIVLTHLQKHITKAIQEHLRNLWQQQVVSFFQFCSFVDFLFRLKIAFFRKLFEKYFELTCSHLFTEMIKDKFARPKTNLQKIYTKISKPSSVTSNLHINQKLSGYSPKFLEPNWLTSFISQGMKVNWFWIRGWAGLMYEGSFPID